MKRIASVEQDGNPQLVEAMDAFLAGLESGGVPDREAFLAGYPEIADELRPCLDAVAFIHGASADGNNGQTELSGQSLGDFRLIREIARGGMGVVYEAEQLSLGRQVALKVLPFAAVLDDRQLQRFRFEAQAAALLHHTNIVPVYAVGQERGLHYYAMQYIPGQSLHGVIEEVRAFAGNDAGTMKSRSAPLDAITTERSSRTRAYCQAVARLGIQAAEALDYAHRQGVIHRDIKPANLMVDAKGHLWITDFGLAMSTNDAGLTMTGDLVGTVRYMSPEQTLAKRVPVDHRTDVYSLGATLYEALTLTPAYPGNDPHQIIHDIAFKDPTLPRRLNSAVPVELETIIQKALAKDPGARYATAAEFAEDLDRFLEHKPIRAKRPGLLDRAGKWARRHRVAVAVGIVILFVAAIGFAISTALIAREQAKTVKALVEAESNFDRAVAAVDAMLLEVGAEDLAGVPFMTRVRERLLQRALDLYTEFLSAQAADPELKLGTARIHRRAAEVLGLLGRGDEQAQALQQALSILERVGSTNPEARREEAATLAQLGRRQANIRDFEGARRFVERARGVQQELTNASGTIEDLHRLAGMHLEVGGVARLDGRHDDAREANRAAVSILERLQRQAATPEWTERLAQGLGGLASLERPPESIELLKRARDLLEQVRSRRDVRSSLAKVLHDLAVPLYSENAQKGLACLDQETALLAELADAFPSVPSYASRLARAHNGVGVFMIDQGHRETARVRFGEAVRIMRDLARRWPTQDHRWWYAAFLGNSASLWRPDQRDEIQEALRRWEEQAAILRDLVEEKRGAHSSAEPTPPLRWSAGGVPWFVPKRLPDFAWHLHNNYSYRGRILFELGRDDEALECFLRRLDHRGVDRDMDGAADLAKFWAGIDGQVQRDPQQAAEIARRGIKQNPDDFGTDSLPALALALYRLGQYEDALAPVNLGLRREHSRGWIFCIAAMIHSKLGQAEAARKALADGCALLDARDIPPTRRMRALRAEAERVLRDG